MTTYQTKQGDTFDSIAFNQSGDRKYTRAWMEANPAYLDMILFSGGIALTIPDIETADTTAANQPPWR